MIKTFLAVTVLGLAVSCVATAQPFGAGIKAGTPLTDAFTFPPINTLGSFAAFTANAGNYVVGPYVEVRLPYRLSVEADALYRKYDFSNAGVPSSTSGWEFPVVVKHKLPFTLVKPYFEAGLSFSRLSDIPKVSINHLSNYGIVAGGGVEINLLLLKISPEIRYTGYALKNFDGLVQSNRNQFTLLVGFGF